MLFGILMLLFLSPFFVVPLYVVLSDIGFFTTCFKLDKDATYISFDTFQTLYDANPSAWDLRYFPLLYYGKEDYRVRLKTVWDIHKFKVWQKSEKDLAEQTERSSRMEQLAKAWNQDLKKSYKEIDEMIREGENNVD